MLSLNKQALPAYIGEYMIAQIKLLRPSHWIKNVVVLFPIIFGLKYDQPNAWISASLVAISFCLLASVIYIINDIVDAESDLQHPRKKTRPIPSGAICKKGAAFWAFIVFCAASFAASNVSKLSQSVLVAYFILQIGYIFVFKFSSLLDVIVLSLGFVLRAIAGAVAIEVFVSPWLFICMFTVFMFMGFCKRYNEISLIGNQEKAYTHRKTLIAYTPQLLTHLIATSSGIAIVSFLSYSLSESTVEHFGSEYFVYSLPLLVYSIFRFAMLSMKGCYNGPTEIILKDRPFQIAAFLWGVMILAVIIYGRELSSVLDQLY